MNEHRHLNVLISGDTPLTHLQKNILADKITLAMYQVMHDSNLQHMNLSFMAAHGSKEYVAEVFEDGEELSC